MAGLLNILILVNSALAVLSSRDYMARLAPRDIVNVDPSGTCPAIPTVTVELQPAYYSRTFSFPTIIYPFRDSRPLTVSAVPTTVIVTYYISHTIYPTTVYQPNGAATTSIRSKTTPRASTSAGTPRSSTSGASNTSSPPRTVLTPSVGPPASPLTSSPPDLTLRRLFRRRN
jgi:hypothetical protein